MGWGANLSNKQSESRREDGLRLGVVTAIAQRLLGAAIPLVSVPLALEQLGRGGYGAWAIAVSLTTVFAFADLGIGTGLMSRIGAVTSERRPSAAARPLVTTAYLLVAGVSAVLLAGLWAASGLTDLGRLADANASPRTEWILVVTLTAFLCNVTAGLITRILIAVGWQVHANLWQMATSLAVLAGMVLAAKWTSGPYWFIAAAGFIPVVTNVATACWFFIGTPTGRSISPSWNAWTRRHAQILVSGGLKFFLVSLLLAISIAMDPAIVAHTSSLNDVASYSVPARIFTIVGLVGVAAVMPLWPLHAKAVADGDVAWIRRITKRVVIYSAVGVSSISICVTAVSSPLMRLWLGGAVEADRVLWAGLACYCILQSLVGGLFMVQNGAEVLMPQLLAYALLIAAIPLKWWASSTFGYALVPWVTAVSYAVIVVPAAVIGYRKSLVKAAGMDGNEYIPEDSAYRI